MNCSSVDPTCATIPSTNLTATENAPLIAVKIFVVTFCLLFGLPTHCYVLWLISGSRNRVESEFFNLNISICEIIFVLFALLYLQHTINQSHTKSSMMTVMKFLTGNVITIRPTFQCLICVERYLAVVHPVTFLKFKALRYRLICCAMVWVIGLGFCISYIYVLGVPNTFMWFSFLEFLLFLFIQMFCLVAVLRALKQSGPGDRSREREDNNPQKRRAFKIIVMLTVTMLIVVVPFTISRFLYIVLGHEVEEVSTFSFFCFVLGGFVPAFLYLRRVGKLPFLKPP